ncbi:MAG: clostripain-related cysteine peptidase [Syntrophomonadaceae bacterium]
MVTGSQGSETISRGKDGVRRLPIRNCAHYLIASEELEPGCGWDYSFLADLAANPQMGGAELGKIIADKFVVFYAGSDEEATLSVIDLSMINDVLEAMGKLMTACNEDFSQVTFKNFAKVRKDTKVFGGGSPRDTDCDMVDSPSIM